MAVTAKKSKLGLGGWLGLLVCILLTLALLCNLAIILQGAIAPERPPSLLGVTPMVVLSGSMSGEQPGHIEVGDLVLVKDAAPESLAVGDVIAYMSGQTTVTHRIIAIDTAADGTIQFTTQGDANDTPDTEPVSASQLVGVYWARIPKLGDVALFLQEPLGMLLCIGAPLAAFILYDVVRRQRSANQAKQRAMALEAELQKLRAQAAGDRDTISPGSGGHTPEEAEI